MVTEHALADIYNLNANSSVEEITFISVLTLCTRRRSFDVVFVGVHVNEELKKLQRQGFHVRNVTDLSELGVCVLGQPQVRAYAPRKLATHLGLLNQLEPRSPHLANAEWWFRKNYDECTADVVSRMSQSAVLPSEK
ncbi:hypothetical protein Tsubulata_002607, partial [Turnera subulata]